jgi:hypothetical protein
MHLAVLVGGSLLFTFAVCEIGVRFLVDIRGRVPLPIRGIDVDKPIRFQPGLETTYESSEFRYRVSFNSHGRRDVEWTAGQIADPGSVIFIGDSFVLGNGVEYESTIPTLLEERLAEAGAPRQVMNFGMPAGAPPTYAMLLEDALHEGFASDTVLVGVFVGNDFYPGVPLDGALDLREKPRKKAPGPRSHLLSFLKLRISQSPLFVGWALSASGALGITLYDTAGSHIFLRRQTDEQRALFDERLAYLGSMHELAATRARTLRVVIFPNKIQVENGDELTGAVFDAELPNRRILEFCAERGISCLDLLPSLRSAYEASLEPLYFPIDRHLNEAGTAVAAEAIARFLLDAERESAARSAQAQ